MSTLLQDLRYGLRMLAKNPGFTAVALLALALGIGANTAIFSVVNGVLLRPLPYPEPARLMMIYERTPEFSQSSVSYPDFLDWQREIHSFTGIAAFRGGDFNFTGSGQAEHLRGELVSASLLPVLGVNPLLGRNFLPQEDQQSAGGVVMLTYGLWKQRFGADPNILGRTLTLDAKNYTVIGVLPSDFRFRGQVELYVPLGQWDFVGLRDRENHPGLNVLGRLKPGVAMAAAQAEMTSIARALAQKYPKTNAGEGATVVGMKDDMVGYIRSTLLLLLGAALLGLLLASWGTRLVLAAVPDTLPRSQGIGLDPYVLLFTLAVSILTGVLFGLGPAFHSSKVNPQEFLKEGARGSGGGRHRAEGIFVVVEVGVAGHVKHWGLDADDTAKIRDEIYFPFLQIPDKFLSGSAAGLTLLLRTAPDPLSVVSAVRAQVAGPTEDQPIFAVETMEQIISDSLTERRFVMLLLGVFASTAVVLAAVGIYGVMSYAVSRRTHELGVRMALGAPRREILRLVVGEGMALAAAGTAVGLAATVGLTRFMASLLYGVRPADPSTLGAVSLLFGGIALLACYIPAWRATRVDPLVALRYE